MKRPRPADVSAALIAVLVAFAGIAAFFYAFPMRHSLPGLAGFVVISLAIGCGVLGARLRR